jgi:hypothetical protein
LPSNGPGRPGADRADPLRKIRYREAAREIVAKDRYDRKNGFAVDTAGAIARALERAYRQGLEDARSDRPVQVPKFDDADGPVEWVLIPPRPRSAFWSICLFVLGKDGQPKHSGYLVPTITERGTPGWQLIVPAGYSDKNPIGERTIMPLIRLGLLELAAGQPERLLISDRGAATWRRFLARDGQFPEDLTSV